jgi:hypothetical protein
VVELRVCIFGCVFYSCCIRVSSFSFCFTARNAVLPRFKSFRLSRKVFYMSLVRGAYIFSSDSLLALSAAAVVRCAGPLRVLDIVGFFAGGKNEVTDSICACNNAFYSRRSPDPATGGFCSVYAPPGRRGSMIVFLWPTATIPPI